MLRLIYQLPGHSLGLCFVLLPPPSRVKVEAALHKAQDKLEALIGPFRLRRTVRSAMTRGMLMPFPVSVQRGKGSARLKQDQAMREVRRRRRRPCSITACFGFVAERGLVS